jgi:hypothetical protein
MMNPNEVRTVAQQAARDAVKETLLAIGIDINDPLAAQRDFASLREWRQSIEAVRSKGFLTLVGIAVTGMLALLWTGLKMKIG